MKTVGLWSGVLFLIVLCLLHEEGVHQIATFCTGISGIALGDYKPAKAKRHHSVTKLKYLG